MADEHDNLEASIDDIDGGGADESAVGHESGTSYDGIDPAFLDELDEIETDGAADASPADSPTLIAAAESPGGDQQRTDAAAKAEGAPPASEDKTADPATAEDAEKLTEEEEKYINSLPPTERDQARRWHKNSRLQTTFLNPKVPAEQWLENLKTKSEMRFNEVTRAIFKEKTADPLKLLNDIYESTADETGYSEKYASLLEKAYETNPEYFKEIFKNKGLELLPAGTEQPLANQTVQPPSPAAAAEIAEIEESASFKQFAEVYPEQAELLLSGLKENSQLREQLAAAAEKTPKDPTPEEKQAAEEKRAADEKAATEAQAAQAAEHQERLNTFGAAYEETVTNYISQKLDKEFGLEVTAAEREKQPLMAFIKEMKALAIKNGVGDMPDFDEGLKDWAKDKEAFQEATAAGVTYANAREKANAAAALKGMQPFADLYLQERLQAPAIQMIDEVMKIVVKAQKAGLLARVETVPNGLGKTATRDDKTDDFLQELDDLR